MRIPVLAVVSLFCAATSGCSDSGELSAATKAATSADSSGNAAAVVDTAGQPVDGTGAVSDSATADAADGLQWQEALAADGPADAVADVAAEDAISTDAAATDVQADQSGDGAAAPKCVNCLFSAQPPAPHPGGKGKYALAPADELAYAPGGLTGNYHKMLVIRPDAGGIFPTVLVVGGKGLYEGGGLLAQLGSPYRAFLDHIASHGYIVAFVRVEQGLLDADHLRMADDLLLASKSLFDQISLADPNKVAFVGHSMGAKVALLAAWKTLNGDQKNAFVDPRAVLAFAISNEPPPMGTFQNALDKAKIMYKDAPTWFTFATGDDDDIAPHSDPKKANGLALYDALPTANKQLIVVHGTGAGDPNPATKPELADDHAAPLSIEGKAGGFSDFVMPNSHLDALDWYGYWKWTVGALDFHFKTGNATWAYGDLRSHGGELPDGKMVTHQVVKQGWTTLPTP
ncbi:MAG: alpha/beta fold hydrolase [Myxococcales bacterium]|nr:alpha/beta fold hydrolase [Myxococcales bacterium]